MIESYVAGVTFKSDGGLLPRQDRTMSAGVRWVCRGPRLDGSLGAGEGDEPWLRPDVWTRGRAPGDGWPGSAGRTGDSLGLATS